MAFKDLADIDSREVIPGYWGKFVHSDHITVAFWNVDAGASLPEHSHPHEQVTTVIEGQFQLTVAGEIHLIKEGGVAVVPGNTPHSGKALTMCRLVDVFHPRREDYQ